MNARNPETSLEVKKAKVLFDAEELVKAPSVPSSGGFSLSALSKAKVAKAETTSSNLQHASTDYAEEKDFEKKCKVCPKEEPNTISKEVEKGQQYHSRSETKERLKKIDEYDKDVRDFGEQTMSTKQGRESFKRQAVSHVMDKDFPTELKAKVEKAEGEYGHITEKDSDENPTVRFKGSKKNKKDTFLPMRETGEPGPKRTKEGYPLKVGANESPKRTNPVGEKGKAPEKDWVKTRERTQVATKRMEEEAEAGHGKMLKQFKEGSFKPDYNSEKRKRGAKVTFRARAATHDEVEAPKTQEHGQATSRQSAESAASQHESSISNWERKNMKKAGKRPEVTEERAPEDAKGTSQPVDKRITKETIHNKSRGEDYHGGKLEKANEGNEEDQEAAEDIQEGTYEGDDYEHAKKTDKDGQWSKKKDPNGTVNMKKARYQKDPDGSQIVPKGSGQAKPTESDEDDEEIMEDQLEEGMEPNKQNKGKGVPSEDETEVEEEEENDKEIVGKDIKKGEFDRIPREGGKSFHQKNKESLKGNASYSQALGRITRDARKEEQVDIKTPLAEHGAYKRVKRHAEEVEAPEALGRMLKGDEDTSESFAQVSKGEPMEDEQDNDVEYVTKALVPIEEIDTIVKARTEEISKAYLGQLDEIKKAYDGKIAELTARVDKMADETIRKGGSVVVIPELLGGANTAMQSNADAIARMQAGQR